MREIKNVFINNSIFENIEIITKSSDVRNLAEIEKDDINLILFIYIFNI